MNVCLHCGQPFDGRSRLYCDDRCRRAKEKIKAKYEKLRSKKQTLQIAAEEARSNGDQLEWGIVTARIRLIDREIDNLLAGAGILHQISPNSPPAFGSDVQLRETAHIDNKLKAARSELRWIMPRRGCEVETEENN